MVRGLTDIKTSVRTVDVVQYCSVLYAALLTEKKLHRL
jgi:hypothetical protein